MREDCRLTRCQPEYLTKILFTKAHCLCHDVNHVTKSAGHIDIIMGFSTGEVIWWEPISQRYTRLNKNVSQESRKRIRFGKTPS